MYLVVSFPPRITGRICVLSITCVVLNVSVSVSKGGVSASDAKRIGGSVAMLESNKLCSLSMCDVDAKIFSVNGSDNVGFIVVGSGSKLLSYVEVTVT